MALVGGLGQGQIFDRAEHGKSTTLACLWTAIECCKTPRVKGVRWQRR